MMILDDARSSGNGWWRLNCPYCLTRVGKEDRSRTLSVRDDSGYWHCFRCGVHGFLRSGELRVLADRATEPRTVDGERPGPPPGFYEITGDDSEALRPAREYVLRPVAEGGRGLPPAVVAAARIGGCVSGRYFGRVVVPIVNGGPAWLGFSARDWTKRASIKYLYPRWMERGSLLYNAGALRDAARSDRPVFAVEGVFDALALWPDAVAFLGKPGDAQIAALACSLRPVCVLLDGDAHREGWGVAMRLRLEGRAAGSVILPPRIDPDEVPRADIAAAAVRAIGSSSAEAAL